MRCQRDGSPIYHSTLFSTSWHTYFELSSDYRYRARLHPLLQGTLGHFRNWRAFLSRESRVLGHVFFLQLSARQKDLFYQISDALSSIFFKLILLRFIFKILELVHFKFQRLKKKEICSISFIYVELCPVVKKQLFSHPCRKLLVKKSL